MPQLLQPTERQQMMLILLILIILGLSSSSSSVEQMSLKYDIIEESGPETVVADVKTAGHLSTKYNETTLNDLRFVFLPSGDDRLNYFVLDPVTGVISRSDVRLDREDICPSADDCVLEMDVAIQPPHFQVIKVDFRILDLNDDDPHFKRSVVKATVPEDTPTGPFLSIQLAQDRDSPLNGIVGYDLQSAGETFELVVERDSSGRIFRVDLVLLEELDRETKDSYEVTVVAFDGGTPSRSGTVTINISVEDVNDNHPRFETTSYEIAVPENSPATKSFLKVHAEDADSGANGRVRYRTSDRTRNQYGHLFQVDEESGTVELLRSLDFETNTRIVLEVLAQDEGPGQTLPAVTRVVVNVVDENDNAPEVHLDEAEGGGGGGEEEGGERQSIVRLREHSPAGTFVVQMTVTDPDTGGAGVVHCSLIHSIENSSAAATSSPTFFPSPSSPSMASFELVAIGDGEYRLLTQAEVDREVTSEYHLKIVCSDFGVPPQQTTKGVTVVIDDINDHTPRFTQHIYNISIAENNPPKQEILRVTAIDADAGNNSRITYTLQTDADNLFEIDKSSGSIWTTRPLDRESLDVYRLLVIARDSGQPEMFSTASVVVNVLDLNDEAPRFDQPRYLFSIEENQPPKAEVGRVRAEDHDSQPYDRYSFYLDATKPNNQMGVFKVDQKTGSITTRRLLNREEKDTYNLTVIVKDDHNLNLQDKAEVTIKVIDVNDNPPSIVFPIPGNDTVQAPVTASLGQLIATIRATDPDSDENARLTFSISAGNDLELFNINSHTGDVIVRSDLRRFDQRTVALTIIAEDNGRPKRQTAAILRINIGVVVSRPFDPSSSGGVDTQLIIVVVLVTGSLLIACALIVVVCFLCRQKREKASRKRHLAAANALGAKGKTSPSSGMDDVISALGAEGDRGSDKSWKGGSVIVGEEGMENSLDGYVVVNRNLANDVIIPSPQTSFDRRSRLYSTNSDLTTRCPCSEVGVGGGVGGGGVGQVYIPQITTDYNNPCYKYISYRPIYCNSDLGLGEVPVLPCPSPDWKIPALQNHQRRPSFSNWLNSESFQLQQKGQTYNVSETNGRTNGRPPGVEPSTYPIRVEPRTIFDPVELSKTYGGRPSPSASFYNRLYPLGEGTKNQFGMKSSLSNHLVSTLPPLSSSGQQPLAPPIGQNGNVVC